MPRRSKPKTVADIRELVLACNRFEDSFRNKYKRLHSFPQNNPYNKAYQLAFNLNVAVHRTALSLMDTMRELEAKSLE